VDGRRIDGKVPLENLEKEIREAVAAADAGTRG
jgi:hypothetical protein